MSTKRVQFAEQIDEDLEQVYKEFDAAGPSEKQQNQTRFGFKEKHSLDSDEEEENIDKYDLMHDDDIEGQEDTKVDIEDGITFTPFNMKEELEEGHFDSAGMYIRKKDKDDLRDNWMDNIDWVKVKEKQVSHGSDDDDDDNDDEDSNDISERFDETVHYRDMIELMKPGETVLKALRRLGGGKSGCSSSSASQRWKAKRQKTTNAKEEPAANKEDLLKLTGIADMLLSNGNLEIYQDTYEKLAFKIKMAEEKSDDSKFKVPKGVDDDDALDMFAEDNDGKKCNPAAVDDVDMFSNNEAENNSNRKESNEESSKSDHPGSGDVQEVQDVQEVMWEYRWESRDDQDVHGPFTSTQMLEWSENGFFDDGCLVRKVNSNADFYNSKRIDFDLYT